MDLSENLCNMLGFNKKKMTSKYGEVLLKQGEKEAELKKQGVEVNLEDPDTDMLHTAEKPYELSGGYHSLFVYSDIVSPSFVGDSFTQLLRLVEIPSNYKFG